MFEILISYDFLVVALGVTILAITSSIVGCFSVYKGQSLVGDAIGHSAYPGVIIAFILFQTRNPIILTIGAALLGSVSYMIIQAIVNNSKIKLDSALAICLTGFFGLGMALKTFIQGNPLFSNSSQAGLKNYIFGLAAFMMLEDVLIILIFSIIVFILLLIFHKELISTIFDRDFSKTVGINTNFIDFILLLMMICLISIGLKSVGAILISSFLLIPCINGNQHSKKLKDVLIIASLTGGISSFIGTYLSSLAPGFSTGPMIIICMSLITGISMIFGKYGLMKQHIKKREYRIW